MSSQKHSDPENENSQSSPDMIEHPSYEELQQQLEATEQQKEQYWDRLLRLQAEMDNLHRRVERDIASAHKFALEKFVTELLSVIDNLERAIEAHAEESVTAGSLLDGIQLTLKMFHSVLEKFGVRQVYPQNSPFDPVFHQAISVQESTDTASGMILNVLQKGYLLNDRLIRPALVVVAK